MKNLTGDKYLLKGINDAGCQLEVDTLTIDEFRDHTEVLCLRNIAASEIRLLCTPIDIFVEELGAAQRENRLK